MINQRVINKLCMIIKRTLFQERKDTLFLSKKEKLEKKFPN